MGALTLPEIVAYELPAVARQERLGLGVERLCLEAIDVLLEAIKHVGNFVHLGDKRAHLVVELNAAHLEFAQSVMHFRLLRR